MSVSDDLEIPLFSRVIIDPAAELTVIDPALGNGFPTNFRPVDILDEEGQAWFGPASPFPTLVGVAISAPPRGRRSNPAETVTCVVSVKHNTLVVNVPIAAILRVLGPDDDIPVSAGPASIHLVAIRVFGLRRAEIPVIPAEHPALAGIDIQSLPREVETAFAVPDAAEIHWFHRNAVFVWAERGPGGWSVYRNNFGAITYWTGPDPSPPALHGNRGDPAQDMFRLINDILVSEANLDPYALDDLGRLVVLDADHRAPRDEAEWEENFLWLVLPWRVAHFRNG